MKINVALLRQSVHARNSVWVIVYDRTTDEVLLLKRANTSNNPGLWNFPGGGTDGQMPVIAAMRELHEESGVRVPTRELEFIHKLHGMDGRDLDYYLHVVDHKPVLNIDRRESSKAKWITLKEAQRLKLHDPTERVVRDKVMRRLVTMAVRKRG